ncbi:unnamed protein product [Pedinophyceae sp. YPF-701]|nr:unnamed protein product [Pedinophyceae sp. YPF-701]
MADAEQPCVEADVREDAGPQLLDLPTDVIHRIFASLRPTDDETQRRVDVCNSVVHPLHDGYESRAGIVYQRAILALRGVSRCVRDLVDAFVTTVSYTGKHSSRRWVVQEGAHLVVNPRAPLDTSSLFAAIQAARANVRNLHFFDIEPYAVDVFASWLQTTDAVKQQVLGAGLSLPAPMRALADQLAAITALRISVRDPGHDRVERLLAACQCLPNLQDLSVRVGRGNAEEGSHPITFIESLPALPSLRRLHIAGADLKMRAMRQVADDVLMPLLESAHVSPHPTSVGALHDFETHCRSTAHGREGARLKELHILQASDHHSAVACLNCSRGACMPDVLAVWPGATRSLRELQVHHRLLDETALAALEALAPTLESLVLREWMVLGAPAETHGEVMARRMGVTAQWGAAQARRLATLTRLTRLELSIQYVPDRVMQEPVDATGRRELDTTQALGILAKGLPCLRTFRFEDCRPHSYFCDAALAALGELPDLRTLILGSLTEACHLTLAGFKALAAGGCPMEHLEIVNMRGISANEIGPAVDAILSGFRNTLRQLRIPSRCFTEYDQGYDHPDLVHSLAAQRLGDRCDAVLLKSSRLPAALRKKRFGNYSWDLGPNPVRDLYLDAPGLPRVETTNACDLCDDERDYDDVEEDCESEFNDDVNNNEVDLAVMELMVGAPNVLFGAAGALPPMPPEWEEMTHGLPGHHDYWHPGLPAQYGGLHYEDEYGSESD